MLSRIREFFDAAIDKQSGSPDPQQSEHALRLATAALLMEISRADNEVTDDERAQIAASIRQVFELNAEETDELVRLAEEEVEHSTSLYQFTSLVDERFTPAQKKHIVELMWRVGAADGHVDKFEKHLVWRISDLLHVSHAHFTHAKHKALNSD